MQAQSDLVDSGVIRKTHLFERLNQQVVSVRLPLASSIQQLLIDPALTAAHQAGLSLREVAEISGHRSLAAWSVTWIRTPPARRQRRPGACWWADLRPDGNSERCPTATSMPGLARKRPPNQAETA